MTATTTTTTDARIALRAIIEAAPLECRRALLTAARAAVHGSTDAWSVSELDRVAIMAAPLEARWGGEEHRAVAERLGQHTPVAVAVAAAAALLD